MYKFIFVLLVVVGMATASNAQEKQNMKQSDNKPLVAYFSVTGTTARAAEKLARVTGGELYAITPVESYTNADLDWNDKRSRSSVEMNDPKSRPAIQEAKKNIADYDVIFIGYPIWWNLAPRIIDTFIETHHLAGKTLIPFATSGGSGITNSVGALKKAYPDLNWKEGKLLNRMDENGIREWIGKTSKADLFLALPERPGILYLFVFGDPVASVGQLAFSFTDRRNSSLRKKTLRYISVRHQGVQKKVRYHSPELQWSPNTNTFD